MKDVDLPPIRVLSTCTGYGGIELGLQLAGGVLGRRTRTLCYVEIELHAAGVLAARIEAGQLDPAPIWSNVKTFT